MSISHFNKIGKGKTPEDILGGFSDVEKCIIQYTEPE